MATSLATLQTRVKTRIRADLATPKVDNLDDTSIKTWANEKTSVVVHILQRPEHFQALHVIEKSIAISSGSGNLPSDYELATAVFVKTTNLAKRKARLLDVPDIELFDESNFITTPTETFPIAYVANGKLYVKPSSITQAYLNYIKKHPTIDNSNGTVWDELADQVLLELIMAEYYSFLEEFDLAAKAEAKARSYGSENA